MALNIGELVGFIRADDRGMRRGLDDAELRMRGFQRDTEGRLRHIDGRFATVGEQIAAGLRTGTDEGRRMSLSLGGIVGAARGLAGVAASIGGIAAKLGAAVPLAAGLAAAVGNIAPAAAVAVTGLFAIQLATNAVKLGMQGVSEAVSAALDPSDPEAYAEALAKLSPEAQKFVKQIRAMQPDLKALQQAVQDQMFKGWSKSLREAAVEVLPVLRKGLEEAAGAVNRMGHGVFAAAQQLADKGTLGKAVSSATAGLGNLTRIPGQLATGLTQVAAAAGPAFERLTEAAGHAFDRLSEKLSGASESGAMEAAVERAINLIGELSTVAANVGAILGSIFGAAEASGGGFVALLQEITGALRAAFASPEVQAGLRAIFATMAEVARTAAPLLIDVLKILGPVFAELGPPLQTLVRALGDALGPVIKELGPVLQAAARAVGALVTAFAPILPVIGKLVASLLPLLTPFLDMLVIAFEALAPVIEQVGRILIDTLSPVIAALAPIVETLAAALGDELIIIMELLGEILVAISPTLVKLGEIFGELLIALAPIIEQMAALTIQILEALMPIIEPLIELIGELAAIFADELAAILEDVVVPALELVVALLSGDWDKAWDAAKRLVSGAIDTIIRWITELPSKAYGALRDFSAKLQSRIIEAGRKMKEAMGQKISETVDAVREMPMKAARALAGIGSRLYSSGRSLIGGFIRGMISRIADVASAASSVVSTARQYFPFSPAKRGPFAGRGWTLYSGQSISEALAAGIASRAGAVQGAAAGLMAGAQGAVGGLHAGFTAGAVPGAGYGAEGAPGGAAGRPVWRVESGGSRLDDLITEIIRRTVRIDGGGDVQRAYGSA
ncbi:phage tail protein [Streptomyces zhihengii]